MDDNTRKRPTITMRSSRRHFVIPGPGAPADLTRRAVFDGMGQGGGFGFATRALSVAIPTNLTVAIDSVSGGLLISWTGTASTYKVYYRLDGGAWTLIDETAQTSYTYVPAAPGEYEFAVSAVQGSLESDKAEWVSSDGIFDDVSDDEGIALMSLYEATDGDNWTTNTNWLTDSTVNNWHGVTVAGGHVTEISMGANNVNGTFDFDLTVFSALDIFDIYLNPNWVSDLTNMYFPSLLRFFRCYGNALSGDLSTWVVNANFRQLIINAGSFTGAPDLSLCTLLVTYQIRNSGLNTAAVDAHIDALYDIRNNVTGTPKPHVRLDNNINGEPSAAAKLKIDELVCDYAWEIDVQNHVPDCGE